MLFTLDTGAGSLSRTRNFDAAEMAKLQAAIDAELQEQGIVSPTNAQRMDYLVGRWVADTITFVRNREATQASAARIALKI
jgi:hypothetical protein